MAIKNNGILFDQADIENWDIANTEQRIDTWNDDGTIRTLYLRHADYDLIDDCGGHANCALAIKKAKAFWWMMARFAGWDGCTAMVGDFNGDCKVDLYDLTIFADAWSAESDSPNWNALCDLAPNGDDCMIDYKDLAVFCDGWLVGIKP